MSPRMNAERHLLANLTPVISKRGEIIKKQEKKKLNVLFRMCEENGDNEVSASILLVAIFRVSECHKESRTRTKMCTENVRPKWKKELNETQFKAA